MRELLGHVPEVLRDDLDILRHRLVLGIEEERREEPLARARLVRPAPERLHGGEQRARGLAAVRRKEHADRAVPRIRLGEQRLCRGQDRIEPPERLGLLVDEGVEPALALLHLLGDAPRGPDGGAEIVERSRPVQPIHGAAEGGGQARDVLHRAPRVDPLHRAREGGRQAIDLGEGIGALGEDAAHLHRLAGDQTTARRQRRGTPHCPW